MMDDCRAYGYAAGMTTITEPLILDFVRSLAAGPRPYDEVMEAWRTSCPRLTIWEDAVDAGLVVRRRAAGAEPVVDLTEKGRALIARRHHV
jgi:hypothetical protein